MHWKTLTIVLLITFIFGNLFAPLDAYAGNPPDQSHSSLSSTGSAPADGVSQITVTVTLEDSSGNPLSGDSVSFNTRSSGSNISPATTNLDSSGNATFSISSTNTSSDAINVVDNATNTTLNGLGNVTFTSPSSTPTPTGLVSYCSDATPGVPVITAATPLGNNQISLTWTDTNDPVSYYLLSYGNSSGNYIYGAPNIGSQGVTTYTVSNLAKNTTYYFAIKAENGCMSGSYSNEISTTTGGGSLSQTSSSTTIQTAVSTPTPEPTNSPTTIPQTPTHVKKIKKVSNNTIMHNINTFFTSQKFIGIAILALLIIGIGTSLLIKVRKQKKKK